MAEQQQQQVDPVAARAFVSQFYPNAEEAQRLPDERVMEYHGKIKPLIDTHVANAIKERGDFGPDWRKTIAAENADWMPTLDRFQSPRALFESYKAITGKVSAGELKAVAPYPDKGTDEQKNAWRTEQGIPTKAEEYKVEPPAGTVIGEEDKPYIDGFLKHAHEANMTPQAVNAAVGWWAKERAARQEAAAVQVAKIKQETDDKLHAEWGQEYRPTMNKIEGLLDAHLPEGSEMRAKLLNTVNTSPDFARFMAGIAMQINPGSTLVPGGAEGQVTSITEWLSKADALMRSDRKAYNAGPAKEYAKYVNAYKTHTGKEWGRG